MKFYPTSIITLFSFLLFVNSLFANYAFKKKVKSVCKTYRITVDSDHFELGDDTFFIDLESGRNNFEMFGRPEPKPPPSLESSRHVILCGSV